MAPRSRPPLANNSLAFSKEQLAVVVEEAADGIAPVSQAVEVTRRQVAVVALVLQAVALAAIIIP